MVSHDNIINFYKTNFGLMHIYNWSLNDIEMMMPFERDIYVGQLMQYIENKNKE